MHCRHELNPNIAAPYHAQHYDGQSDFHHSSVFTYHHTKTICLTLSMLTSVSLSVKDTWAPAAKTAGAHWCTAVPEPEQPLGTMLGSVVV